MLLNICMKPLGEFIKGFQLLYHQCVDDTQLYHSIISDPKEMVELLYWCPEMVMGWTGVYKFYFGSGKWMYTEVG